MKSYARAQRLAFGLGLLIGKPQGPFFDPAKTGRQEIEILRR